ncbi:MAG TPA: mismatch-specific DNA-glycosylase [Egibacteraceae bacterium]|nr:mismatch-specific DNA-glycosylase [Egibacteraceae bacterium]
MTGPLPDITGPGMRLLLVGINPGRRSAALGRHFAGHGNRFWPALYDAGITPEPFGPADQTRLPALGVGLTNIVERETATAKELSPTELRAGGQRLVRMVGVWGPAVVAVLGVTAYRLAFDDPRAALGRRPHTGGDASWWVLPNPSGLNAHAKPADHARWLRTVAVAAGLPVATRGATG